MFVVRFLVLVNLFRLFYSEWIEIAQIADSFNESSNNRSLTASSEKAFDYSTYKDFFNIIGSNVEFVENITPLQKNPIENSMISNKFNDQHSDFHHFQNQLDRNDLLVHTSNVSILKSVFNDSMNKAPMIDPIKMSINQQKPNANRNRVIFKRLEIKPFNFSNILKFLASMQKSFSMDPITGVTEKIEFLMQFKENLLENIDERLKMLWPPNGSENNRRIRRSPSSHGSLDFPASETALMTISFLTLAVFLIKLVLQVIHTIKSKHVGYQTMTPLTANETPIKIIKNNLNARKLSISTDDLLRTATEAIKSI